MDRNTAAALGQNLSNAFSDIGQIFDPRARAAADQQRLAVEGLRLKNTGQGIENEYAPRVFGSQIALNTAKAGTEGAQQGVYNEQTKNWKTRNQALSDLYSSTGLPGFVKEFEGFNPNAYSDGAQTSIGYGTKARPGETSVTTEEGERRLAEELQASTNRINNAASQFGINLAPAQRDAMISFDYNTGKGVNLLERFGNDPQALTSKMLEYRKSEGKVLPGLERRRAAEVDMFRSAILSSVAGGGGDPQQLNNALNTAKAAQIFYDPNATPDAIRVAQAATGTANPQFNTVAGTTAEAIKVGDPKLRSEEAIAAGNAQMKLIGDLYGGSSTRRGDGSMLGLPKTAPNSFSDARKVDELAQDAGFRVFGVPVDDEGAPTEDPFAPSRRAWSQSFSNAMSAGMTPIEAEAAANVHHFGTDQPEINSENTFRFGFGKDPSLPTMKNTEPLQASPEFGVDQEKTAALIGSIPELFGLPPVQPQQGNPNVGTPVTGVALGSTQEAVPPMLQRPAEQPAKVEKLSDQFKRREGSTERKAREAKEKEIAALEAEIKDTLDILNTGQVNVPAGLMNGGMMSGAFTPPSGPVTLSDDGYNRNIDRLEEMEAKLEKLKGGRVQAGQDGAADLESRLSKYK